MKNLVVLTCMFIAYLPSIFAQQGYSSASVGMTKAKEIIPQPSEIIVEEYINYHTHNIPLPSKNKAVNLDLSWTRGKPFTNDPVLQVGLTTANLELHEIPPINVSLVIDRSGSMSGDRIKHTKQACKEFVQRLRSQDVISIVLFSNGVEVLIPSQKVGNNNAQLLQKIQEIQVGGGTNLNSGLLKGYEQVTQNYQNQSANRVIMLTDALTNTGQIDPSTIVKNSTNYKEDYQIDIAVIGVGVNFNNALSRQLTSSNKSSIHFINDAADIKKVFIDELESLMSPVAKDVKLELVVGDGLAIQQLYGYQADASNNTFSLELDNINNGLTQVLLATFKNDGYNKSRKVRAKLHFYNIQTKQQETIEKVIELPQTYYHNISKKDTEVLKNFTIAQMAQTLKEASIKYHTDGKPQEAQKQIDQVLNTVTLTYNLNKEKDIKFIYDLLAKYRQQLLSYNK
ncbi:MAG: VWA domain-containing protein [Aureispira sp.]|nr:VWA domain-containing protein [Aureispira sp.]